VRRSAYAALPFLREGGRSTATYRQASEGNWQCQIRKKGYKPVSATFDKKSDAQGWAAKIEGRMVNGQWRDRDESDSTTLEECLQRYLDEVSSHKKGHTNERYRILACMADPIAKKPLSQIRSVDLANWKIKRLKVVSGTMARNEWGLNVDNPMDRRQSIFEVTSNALTMALPTYARRCGVRRPGLTDADLAGGLIKQRVARAGQGRSRGFNSSAF
jgi:hypothetical protein